MREDASMYVKAAVLRRYPNAKLRGDGVFFWIEADGERLGRTTPFAWKAWFRAYEFLEAE
jgi:hypothetical protein